MTSKENIKKILKEETQDIDTTILNFLKRRASKTKHKIYDDTEITWVQFVGTEYNFNTFRSKKEMTRTILDMLEDDNVINLGDYNPNVLDKDRQKVIRTIRYFINEYLK